MRRLTRRIWIPAVAVIVGATAVLGIGIAHADSPVYRVTLVNVNSSKCLEVGHYNAYLYSYADQATCNTGYGYGYTEQWQMNLSPGATNVYTLRSFSSSKCLDTNNTVNFSSVFQASCDGSYRQAWRKVPVSTSSGPVFCTVCDAFELQNLWSGRCLEIGYYKTTDWATANLYDCYGGNNQRWYVGSAFYGYT